MTTKEQKTVGIIGGMGPEATVELMRRIIDATPAEDDSDHIHMLVDNNPKIPSRIKALIEGTGESPVKELVKMAQGLEHAGADFLVMPCNTAHHYYPEIEKAVSIPFINLIDLSAQYIQRNFSNIKNVGLLASTAVINLNMFSDTFTNQGINTLVPDELDQGHLMQVIKTVKRNSVTAQTKQTFSKITNALNTDLLLIACTELSTLAKSLHTTQPAIDTLDLLANEVIFQTRQ